MKLAVSITHMDGVLYATYTGGKCTAQEILYHKQDTVSAAKRHHCDRVLIVVNIIASAHVLEKLGLKLEGRLREKEYFKGRWWDTLMYGMLKEEWHG